MLSVSPMVWGMKNPKCGQLVINAREESVADKAMFSRILRTQRCILPAEQFYEWDADKHKVMFHAVDGALLYLCGIYRYEGAIPHFVILTKSADSIMEPVHDRMPVMVGAQDVRVWLFDARRTQELIASNVHLNGIVNSFV